MIVLLQNSFGNCAIISVHLPHFSEEFESGKNKQPTPKKALKQQQQNTKNTPCENQDWDDIL